MLPPVPFSLQSLYSCTKYTHLAFAPSQQREVPGGGDQSQWQRRSAAASRTAMCGFVCAFGDDLVSQSLTLGLLTYGDHTGQIHSIHSHRREISEVHFGSNILVD